MDRLVTTVRTFNRFFTRYVGAMDPGFLGTDLSLAEARILYEIANSDGIVAAKLAATLDMDRGFVSRVLRRFETKHWVRRGPARADRTRPLALTRAGRTKFEDIDTRQVEKVRALLNSLTPSQRNDLTAHLSYARLLMGDVANRDFTIRTFRIGDLGYLTSRQSILYHETYGWSGLIEANEGEVISAFIRKFKPGREQCWIAEIGGAMVGSIILTDEGNDLSRLRLLYVEPVARGLGIASALVDECIAFAKAVGFKRMTLWTHTVLESARRIYAAKEFKLVKVQMHEEFGEPLQGETWEAAL
jgi:DNA-binding MarR family transcriptional regulator/N-acetylglutamate synthase-like GNAT family acetyltransferase